MKDIKELIIKKASLELYPVIQNMARFYVYDLSRSCGLASKDWALPKDGLYESFDFKNYFTEKGREAYIVEINGETVGFVLINQETTSQNSKWNMGEFFILARFQNKGYGEVAAEKIWEDHPGIWEVAVIPENSGALSFWRKTIRVYARGNFQEETKLVDFDEHQPNRIIFTFEAGKNESI